MTKSYRLIIASSLVIVFFLLSIIFSLGFASIVYMLLLLTLLCIVLYGVENNKNTIKIASIALIVILIFLNSFFKSSFVDKARLVDALFKAIGEEFIALPLFALQDKKEKRRGVKALFLALISIIVYFFFERTNNNYYYLYSSISDYKSFIFYSRLLFISIVLSCFFNLFAKNRSYLSYFLALSSGFLSCFRYGKIEFLDSDAFYFLLIFIIYCVNQQREKITIERKKIVFSEFKPIVIEPIKKKKKEKVFDLPPNIPVNDLKNDDKKPE